MKKSLAILLALDAVLLVGVLLKKKDAVVQAAGGDVPIGNGDVNGDGLINISDVVYTLSWLFQSGEELVAIECPPTSLPGTGQTLCYDAAGTEIDCGSADYPGQDAFYRLGCPVEGRYMDHGDGTVTDTCTGLMWQKDTADVDGSGSIGDEDRINWQSALKYCDGLDFAGHDDWRLPNVRELQTIFDYKHINPSIDPVFGAMSDRYWSSSSFVNNPSYTWFVVFNIGVVSGGNVKGNRNFVRAVRSGP